MSPFITLLKKPAKERRRLDESDIQTLAGVELNKEWWTPSKALSALEVMQIALKDTIKKQAQTSICRAGD
jgi:hypothetical protein